MFPSSHPIPHYDAVIVGARCAGAATALLLARQGLRVLAVDRQGHGSDTLSTHALMRGAVMLLARWGVLPDLLAAGTPEIRRTVFHFGARTLEIPIKAGHGVAALVAPRRTRLDRLLVDHAVRAGAEVRFGTTLAELVRRDDDRVVGAVLRDAAGNRTEVRCDLLIGAEGLRSHVAQEVRAPVLRRAQHSMAAIYGYWDGFDPDAYHWHYAPRAAAGVIATHDEDACVFAGTSEARAREELRGDLPDAYRRLFREAAPEVAERTRRGEGRLRAFWGAKGFLRQARGPGWALVGNAGYFKDPLTSHGIADPFRDAEGLALAVAEGTDAALARNQEERDALSGDLFAVTDEIASFAWDMDEVQRHLERLAAAMKAELAAISGRGALLEARSAA